jgi:anti-sigma regulatory factor (Ser/Thr protein kinase)
VVEAIAELRIPAKPERLRLVRGVVGHCAELAGGSPELTARLVLAVNEACMNVVQHAYKGPGTGDMILTVLQDGAELVFRLRDFAPPIDLTQIEGRDRELVRPGGLGMHFMRQIMDEVAYARPEEGEGNLVEMRKRLKG